MATAGGVEAVCYLYLYQQWSQSWVAHWHPVALFAFPFFAWLAFVGVPLEYFVAADAVNYFIQFYNHNGVVGKLGWLEYVLITLVTTACITANTSYTAIRTTAAPS